MCGELVTQADAGGKRTGPGGGREAQVPLSRLHLLLGTLRTRAGWGSADSATPRAPCLSTFQSPGKTGNVGKGLPGRMGTRREIQIAAPHPSRRRRTDGGRWKGDSSAD